MISKFGIVRAVVLALGFASFSAGAAMAQPDYYYHGHHYHHRHYYKDHGHPNGYYKYY